VLLRPLTFQIRFLQAVAERSAVQLSEVLIKALHLLEPLPFGHERLGTDDEHGGNIHPRAELLDDQPRFNRLSNPDLIRDQEPGSVGTYELQHWTILIRHELHSAGTQRVKIGSRAREDLQGSQASAEFVRRDRLRLLRANAATLRDSWLKLRAVTDRVVNHGDLSVELANATPYLEAFGSIAVAWLWLWQAVAARRVLAEAPNDDFANGKIAACSYYFIYVLPEALTKLGLVELMDQTCLAVTPEQILVRT